MGVVVAGSIGGLVKIVEVKAQIVFVMVVAVASMSVAGSCRSSQF